MPLGPGILDHAEELLMLTDRGQHLNIRPIVKEPGLALNINISPSGLRARPPPGERWNHYRHTAELFSSLFILNFTHFMHIQGQFLTQLLSCRYLLSSVLKLPVSYSPPASLRERGCRRKKGRKTGGPTESDERRIKIEAGARSEKKKNTSRFSSLSANR